MIANPLVRTDNLSKFISCLRTPQTASIKSRLWSGLAISSAAINLLALAITGAAMPSVVAGCVAIGVALLITFRERKLAKLGCTLSASCQKEFITNHTQQNPQQFGQQKTSYERKPIDSVTRISNCLDRSINSNTRLLGSYYAAHLERFYGRSHTHSLGFHLDGICFWQFYRLDEVEKGLGCLSEERGTTTDKLVALVKEHGEILDRMKVRIARFCHHYLLT